MSEPTPVYPSASTNPAPAYPTHVDGIEIVAREQATNFIQAAQAHRPVKNLHKVLLADGRELIQCVHPDACWKTYGNVAGGIAHLQVHSSEKKVRVQEAKDAAERERRSNGIREGHAAKQERVDAIETITLSEALKREADSLETRALWLRSMAVVATRLERAQQLNLGVTPEELTRLRADAQQFQQLRNLLGK